VICGCVPFQSHYLHNSVSMQFEAALEDFCEIDMQTHQCARLQLIMLFKYSSSVICYTKTITHSYHHMCLYSPANAFSFGEVANTFLSLTKLIHSLLYLHCSPLSYIVKKVDTNQNWKFSVLHSSMHCVY
jgi:hypothetical protein